MISLLVLLVSVILTCDFAITVQKLHFSGGFGGNPITIQMINKEILYRYSAIGCLAAALSTILAFMSKLKVYIIVNLIVMILLNILNLYMLFYLKLFPVGSIALVTY